MIRVKTVLVSEFRMPIAECYNIQGTNNRLKAQSKDALLHKVDFDLRA